MPPCPLAAVLDFTESATTVLSAKAVVGGVRRRRGEKLSRRK